MVPFADLDCTYLQEKIAFIWMNKIFVPILEVDL